MVSPWGAFVAWLWIFVGVFSVVLFCWVVNQGLVAFRLLFLHEVGLLMGRYGDHWSRQEWCGCSHSFLCV